jgi:hypothetical protein
MALSQSKYMKAGSDFCCFACRTTGRLAGSAGLPPAGDAAGDLYLLLFLLRHLRMHDRLCFLLAAECGVEVEEMLVHLTNSFPELTLLPSWRIEKLDL